MKEKKRKPKTKSKLASKPKGSREQEYLDKLDLLSLWERFATERNGNGTVKWKTVWQLITKETNVDWQRKTLWWVLGPPAKDAQRGNISESLSALPQMDWETKRREEKWLVKTDTVEELNKAESAFGRLAILSSGSAKFIERLNRIVDQIDAEFTDGLFLPNLSQKENAERVKLCLHLNQRLLDMMQQAQQMYGALQGIDIRQLPAMLAIAAQNNTIGESMGMIRDAVNQKSEKSVGDKFRDMLAESLMEKSNVYGIPIPNANEISGKLRVIK